MNAGQRLVTVLVTVAVPDAADPSDAATLVALAAETTALDVVHTAAVEGHLPLPGSTVLRGRQLRPWLVKPGSTAAPSVRGGSLGRDALLLRENRSCLGISSPATEGHPVDASLS